MRTTILTLVFLLVSGCGDLSTSGPETGETAERAVEQPQAPEQLPTQPMPVQQPRDPMMRPPPLDPKKRDEGIAASVLRNGKDLLPKHPKVGREILQSVVDRYPNTEAAKEAKELLEQ